MLSMQGLSGLTGEQSACLKSPSRGMVWSPNSFSYSNDSGMIGDRIRSFSRSQNDESGSSSRTVS